MRSIKLVIWKNCDYLRQRLSSADQAGLFEFLERSNQIKQAANLKYQISLRNVIKLQSKVAMKIICKSMNKIDCFWNKQIGMVLFKDKNIKEISGIYIVSCSFMRLKVWCSIAIQKLCWRHFLLLLRPSKCSIVTWTSWWYE